MIVIVVSNTNKCFFCFPDNKRSHALTRTWKEQKQRVTHSPIHSFTHTQRQTASHAKAPARRHEVMNGNELIRTLPDARTHTFDGHTHTHTFLLLCKFLSATSWRVTLFTQLFKPPTPHQDPKAFLPPPPTRSHVYTWAGSHTVSWRTQWCSKTMRPLLVSIDTTSSMGDKG